MQIENREQFELSLKRGAEAVAKLQDDLNQLELQGDSPDLQAKIREDVGIELTHVAAMQARMVEIDRAIAANPNPTEQDRARVRDLIEQGAPEIAIFGRAAGFDGPHVVQAEEVTRTELAGRDRIPGEDRIYSAMPGENFDVEKAAPVLRAGLAAEMVGEGQQIGNIRDVKWLDNQVAERAALTEAAGRPVTILDAERTRLQIARGVAAINLVEDRTLNGNRSVSSEHFLEDINSHQVRSAVDASLDEHYGRGTALAIHQMRPSLEAYRDLKQAEFDQAPQEAITAAQQRLDTALEDQAAVHGNRSVALAINLLPGEERATLGQSYERHVEKQREIQRQQEHEARLSPEQRARNEHKAVIADARKEYQTMPAARENYDRSADAFDKDKAEQIRVHGGSSPNVVLDREAVQRRADLAEIRSGIVPGEEEIARHYKAVLHFWSPDREITAHDLDTKAQSFRDPSLAKPLERDQRGWLTQDAADQLNASDRSSNGRSAPPILAVSEADMAAAVAYLSSQVGQGVEAGIEVAHEMMGHDSGIEI